MTSFQRSSMTKSGLERDNSSRSFASSQIGYGLTFSRNWLIHIAQQTVSIADEGKYLNKHGEEINISEALKYTLDNSKHYHSSHNFNPSKTTKSNFKHTTYCVCYGSSLEIAGRLQEQLLLSNEEFEIGILNSASAKHPDKFFRGTLSQEESICRACLLYPCLMKYYGLPHHFYSVNMKPKYYDSSSSCAIYSPRVPVIREDSVQGNLLDDYKTYSIVSIPAPNAFALGTGEEGLVPEAQAPGAGERKEDYGSMTVNSAMHDRVFRALSIFAEQGCTDLVLCAFGCGVHGNDPKHLAICFREILSDELKGRFRTVAFAINPSRHKNFEEFAKVFENIGEGHDYP